MPVEVSEIVAWLGATLVGGATAGLAVTVWLGKSLVSQRLGKDLEKFKTDLRTTADAEVERLRLRHQMTLHGHEKRSDAVREVHQRIVLVEMKLQLLASRVIAEGDSFDKRWDDAFERLTEARYAYVGSRILFDEASRKNIEPSLQSGC